MSEISLHKQLPKNHIIESRFIPYEKASTYIKHLNNVYCLNQNTSAYDNIKDVHHQFKSLSPEGKVSKHSCSPTSKLSKELEDQIIKLNLFQNLSNLKRQVTKKSRAKSIENSIHIKTIDKMDKNKYTRIMNKINTGYIWETRKASIFSGESQSRRKIFKDSVQNSKKKTFNEAILESTLASDRLEIDKNNFSSNCNILDEEKFIRLPRIKIENLDDKKVEYSPESFFTTSPGIDKIKPKYNSSSGYLYYKKTGSSRVEIINNFYQ
jgi:hypothetical protein